MISIKTYCFDRNHSSHKYCMTLAKICYKTSSLSSKRLLGIEMSGCLCAYLPFVHGLRLDFSLIVCISTARWLDKT